MLCEVNEKGIVIKITDNTIFSKLSEKVAYPWTKEGETYSEEPPLEYLKSQNLQVLKKKRDALEVEPIECNGNLYDYDEKARDRINAAIIALDVQGNGASIEWTTADNTNVIVTADDLREVIATVAVRSNALHVKYRELKEQVLACTTNEEVALIEW